MIDPRFFILPAAALALYGGTVWLCWQPPAERRRLVGLGVAWIFLGAICFLTSAAIAYTMAGASIQDIAVANISGAKLRSGIIGGYSLWLCGALCCIHGGMARVLKVIPNDR